MSQFASQFDELRLYEDLMTDTLPGYLFMLDIKYRRKVNLFCENLRKFPGSIWIMNFDIIMSVETYHSSRNLWTKTKICLRIILSSIYYSNIVRYESAISRSRFFVSFYELDKLLAIFLQNIVKHAFEDCKMKLNHELIILKYYYTFNFSEVFNF